jgi:tetratricopeptide (TPR) repeat protein
VIIIAALAVGAAVGRIADRPDSANRGAASAAPATGAPERVRQFEEATRTNPDDARAWQQLAIASVQAVAQGEPLALYNSAADALQRAEALAPGDRMNDVAGGYLALARHDFARARVLGQRAHVSDRFDSDALAILVDANVEMGYYRDATRAVEKLLALRPSLAAYSRLSYMRELHGDVEGALDAFALAENAGTGSAPDLANVLSLRGNVAVAHGDPDEAERSFNRARTYLSDTTNDAGAAHILIARGDVAAARTLLESVMRETPEPDVALFLDEIYVVDGNDAGRADIARFLDGNAAEERAAGADVDVETSLIAADRGRWKEALRLARSAYETRPRNVFTAAALAWALHGNDRAREARPLIEQALRLGTRDAVLRYRAAEIFAANGARARAAQELTTAFAINPHFSLRYRADACALGARIGVPCPSLG